MIINRSHILLKLCMLLLLLEAATSQSTSATPAASAATTVPGASTDPPTAATNAGTTSDGTTENTTLCENYDFLCNLEELPMIALLVAPGVGLLLIAVVIAVACRVCGGKSDDDDEIFMERERTSQIAMNDYRSNMAASSVAGEDDFSGRQKTNPAYMEDDEVAFNHTQRNFGRPSVSSGSDRMAMDNRRQRMSMASVDRPYGEDHRRPGSHYPDDDMRHPPGRPAQYGDDPRRAGSRYMEEDPRRPPPDSRGRPYGHPGDRDDGRRPLASSPMYDKSEPRGGPRPQQPQQSSAGGRRNWAKQSAAPHDVPPADYDDGFPNPRSSYAGFNRQDVSNYY